MMITTDDSVVNADGEKKEFGSLSVAKKVSAQNEKNPSSPPAAAVPSNTAGSSSSVNVAVRATHVGDAGAAHAAALLRDRTTLPLSAAASPSLVSIDISGNQTRHIGELCDALAALGTQHDSNCGRESMMIGVQLDVSDNPLTHKSSEQLAAALQVARHLRVQLNLCGTNCLNDESSWTTFFDSQKDPTTATDSSAAVVTHLLDCNEVYVSSRIHPLLFRIAQSVHLTHLSLCNCELGNEAIRCFAEGFSSSCGVSSSLEVLKLSDNQIGSIGLRALSIAFIRRYCASSRKSPPCVPMEGCGSLEEWIQISRSILPSRPDCTSSPLQPMRLKVLDLSGNRIGHRCRCSTVLSAAPPVPHPPISKLMNTTGSGGSELESDGSGLLLLSQAMVLHRGTIESIDASRNALSSKFGTDMMGVAELCEAVRSCTRIRRGAFCLHDNGLNARTIERLNLSCGLKLK